MSESDEVERVHAALDQTCNCGHHIDDHGSDIAGCYLCHDDGVPTPCEREFLDLCAEAIVPLLDERAAQARAEVADAWQQGEWTVLTPKIRGTKEPIGQILGAAQAVTEWLRARAAEADSDD